MKNEAYSTEYLRKTVICKQPKYALGGTIYDICSQMYHASNIQLLFGERLFNHLIFLISIDHPSNTDFNQVKRCTYNERFIFSTLWSLYIYSYYTRSKHGRRPSRHGYGSVSIFTGNNDLILWSTSDRCSGDLVSMVVRPIATAISLCGTRNNY